MEAAYSILLIFAAFLAGETFPQRLRRDKRNLIIGGRQIAISEAPYQAALYVNGEFWCGGSIISARWILTAGHCLPRGGEIVTIRVGSTLMYSGGTVIKALRSIRHPNYVEDNSKVEFNDLALVFLEESVHFDGSHVSCVSLPQKGERLQAGTVGKVSGWGQTSHNLGYSDSLLAAYSTVLPFEQCREAYFDLYTDEEKQYCIGDRGVNKGSCKGDSGGPFAVGKTLYGVVSWGINCTDTHFQGMYTDVAAFLQWIQDTVASVSSLEELNCQ
ncbi:trypsin 5G1-like [Sabethes cyaneus]|uniref:trypsin 5G1-like n=1 Tax=Sabethes cyaneus TaxID=53552 RepID=UPI00237D8BA6|nr:trypsin 5G1-like [Sabethes cyaneus]